MISIIDYGMGNIRSVQNALRYLGVKSEITDSPEKIVSSDKLVLPGVGAFNVAMHNIHEKGLLKPLNEAVLEKKIPILGICLGMQLLAQKGYEGGLTDGLGWIEGTIERFDDSSPKIPHIGFNTTQIINKPHGIFNGLGGYVDFYYVHSYRMICKDSEDVTSWTEYGERFVSSVKKENIFGTQFHPEKSQINGLRVLRNFLNLGGEK